ncbi:MAG: hypothetical protein ABI410_13535 [Rhodoferax sp.]|uniref:hypothetical protein n=1 Tax=Rhodoferax sp. TaxID=50421 RepID=UPI003264946F
MPTKPPHHPPLRPHLVRPWALMRTQQQLQQNGYPRLQMALLVALTGLSGLLASFVMLGQGVTAMALRYPLALLVAYLVFLVLLWLWLRSRADDYLEVPDLLQEIPTGNGTSSGVPLRSGSGGDFGGGGASASFDTTGSINPPSVETNLGDGLGDALGSVADADEWAIPLVVLLLGAGLALSMLYMVYAAPVLFAELLLDGVLSASLYRNLRGLQRQHWLTSAFRRTALPFVLTGVFLCLSGWAMQAYAPHAHSIGDVLQQLHHRA